MHGHNFAILNEPRTLLHLHFIIQLPVNDRWLSLEPYPEVPPLDVHHYVFPLQPEVDTEGHCQLDKTQALRSGH
jgi:hypothetical protein